MGLLESGCLCRPGAQSSTRSGCDLAGVGLWMGSGSTTALRRGRLLVRPPSPLAWGLLWEPTISAGSREGLEWQWGNEDASEREWTCGVGGKVIREEAGGGQVVKRLRGGG